MILVGINTEAGKKTDGSLSESEPNYRNTVENAPIGIYEIAFDGSKIRYVNPTVSQWLGYSKEELLTMNPLDLLTDESKGKFQEIVIEAVKGEKTFFSAEYEIRTKNGQSFWGMFHAKVNCKAGIPDTVQVFVQDITESKKAQEAHRKAEEQFRGLVESTSDIIWQVDENTVYTYISPKVKDVLGYEPEEVVGKTPFDLIDEEDEEKIINSFLEIANKKEPFYGLENWNIHKNGSRVLLETSGVPILDEKGQLMGYRGIDRDITERKQAEQALKERTMLLEQTQKKLQENAVKLEEYANQMEQLAEERARELQDKERLAAIGATAGMVGHDIRNPLQAIVSELFLARQVLDEAPTNNNSKEVLESINLIQEQVEYINKIIVDLQDFARPLKPEYAIVNLPDLLVSVFDAITLPDEIKLKVDVKGKLILKTDPTFIRRAITNLVNNAIQAMPDGGELGLTVQKKEDCVIITVSDTGHGIPEHVKANLFKPLMTTKSKGQGLGLAVVKRLIEALNGKVTFESEGGKGTKFIIELPTQG